MRPVPPPLPPPSRSSRNLRTAQPVDAGAEAPMLYSRVGRRSSPGFPAEPIAVESVRVPAAPMSEHERSAVFPIDAPSEAVTEAVAATATATAAAPREATEPPPATERTGSGRPRPHAPEPFLSNLSDGESIALTLDRLMASDERPPSQKAPAPPPFPSEPPTGPRELFETLAVSHVRPVRELLIELRWGHASKDSFVSAAAAVQSLKGAAESLSLRELAAALGAFGVALSTDASDATTRAAVIRAYDELLRLLPTAFAFEAEHAQRESFLVQSLVLRVADASRATLEKIVAAGCGTIATLADARPHELADVAGISIPVAARIINEVNAYREGHHTASSDINVGERDRLRALSVELAQQHDAFERACESWTASATTQKRQLRHAREQTLLAISALLARLGEIPLLERIEKLPFEQKLVRLNSYLNQAPLPPSPR